MGRTVRFDQIYVASLDSDPRVQRGNIPASSGGIITINNLVSESISASSNISIHAVKDDGNDTTSALTLKSGPAVSNVSVIEVYGANTSSTHQNIRFKTKNTERMRIASDGKIGIANTNPSEALTISGNVHVLGSNALVLGTNKSMRVYSDPSVNESKIENTVGAGKGLSIYVSQSSAMGNPKMVILENSNVGIGTDQPATRFHVYDGIPRIQSSASNATIEFTTTGGTSNIHSDVSGNVHIVPSSSVPTTIINGGMEVTGNFSSGGTIDLGNAVGIGLGDETANTTLHVNGGFISNSDQVACKRYSNTFAITSGDGQDIQLIFDTHVFYAKVVAMLKNSDDVSKTSTMILEIQGGAPDLSVGSIDVFGVSDHYWSSTVTTGTGGIDIRPYIIDDGTDYTYDIFVEVVTSAHGGLKRISNNINDIGSDLNFIDGAIQGGQITKATFTY